MVQVHQNPSTPKRNDVDIFDASPTSYDNDMFEMNMAEEAHHTPIKMHKRLSQTDRLYSPASTAAPPSARNSVMSPGISVTSCTAMLSPQSSHVTKTFYSKFGGDGRRSMVQDCGLSTADEWEENWDGTGRPNSLRVDKEDTSPVTANKKEKKERSGGGFVPYSPLYKPKTGMTETADIAKQVVGDITSNNIMKSVADSSTAVMTTLTDYLGNHDPQCKLGKSADMIKCTLANNQKVLTKNTADGTYYYQSMAQTKDVDKVNAFLKKTQPDTSKMRLLKMAMNKQPLMHMVSTVCPYVRGDDKGCEQLVSSSILATPLELARQKIQQGLRHLVRAEDPEKMFEEMLGAPGCDITTDFMADLRKMYIYGAPAGGAALKCSTGAQYSYAATAANLSLSTEGDNLLFHLVKSGQPALLAKILAEFSCQTCFGDERNGGGKVHPGNIPKGFKYERGGAWMRWKEERAPKWIWTTESVEDDEKALDIHARPKIPDPAKHRSQQLAHEAGHYAVGSWKLQEYGCWEKVSCVDVQKFGLNMRTQLKPHLCLVDVNRIRAKTSIFHCALEYSSFDCLKVLLEHAEQYDLRSIIRDGLNAKGQTLLSAVDSPDSSQHCWNFFNLIANTLLPEEGAKYLYDSNGKKTLPHKLDESAKGKGKGTVEDPKPRFAAAEIPGTADLTLERSQECGLQAACITTNTTKQQLFTAKQNGCLAEKHVSLKSKKAVAAHENVDFYAWDHVCSKICVEGMEICTKLDTSEMAEKIFKLCALNFTGDCENDKMAQEFLTAVKKAASTQLTAIHMTKCGVPNPALTLATFLASAMNELEKSKGTSSMLPKNGLVMNFLRASGKADEDANGDSSGGGKKKGKKGGNDEPAGFKSLIQQRKELEQRKIQVATKFDSIIKMQAKDQQRRENKKDVAAYKDAIKEIHEDEKDLKRAERAQALAAGELKLEAWDHELCEHLATFLPAKLKLGMDQLPMPVVEKMLDVIEEEWDLHVSDSVRKTVEKVLYPEKFKFQLDTREKKNIVTFDLRKHLNEHKSHWAAEHTIKKTPHLMDALHKIIKDPKLAKAKKEEKKEKKVEEMKEVIEEGPKKITDTMLAKVYGVLADRLVKFAIAHGVYEFGLVNMIHNGRVTGQKQDVILEPDTAAKFDAYMTVCALVDGTQTAMASACGIAQRYFPLEKVVDGHAPLSFQSNIKVFLKTLLDLLAGQKSPIAELDLTLEALVHMRGLMQIHYTDFVQDLERKLPKFSGSFLKTKSAILDSKKTFLRMGGA